MVSKELLSELEIILKEDFGLSLDSQKLNELANSFLNFFDLLAKVQYQTGGEING